jgi:transposase
LVYFRDKKVCPGVFDVSCAASRLADESSGHGRVGDMRQYVSGISRHRAFGSVPSASRRLQTPGQMLTTRSWALTVGSSAASGNLDD